MIKPTKINLDRQKSNINVYKFVRGDLAVVEFTVADNGVPITDFTKASIIIRKKGKSLVRLKSLI